MKKFLTRSVLVFLLAGSAYNPVIFATSSDDEILNSLEEIKTPCSLESFKVPEIEDKPTPRRSAVKRKRGNPGSTVTGEDEPGSKKKKSEKPEKNKRQKASKAKASGGFLEAAEQAGTFVMDHKDTILLVAGKTSEVADSLIGDGDGKLSPSEVIDALKDLAGKLLSVKDVVGGLFKKKDDAVPSTGEEPAQPAVKRSVVPGVASKRAAAHLSNLYPKSLSPQGIMEKVGDKFNDVHQALSSVALHVEKLTDLAPAELQDFIGQHHELKGRVGQLIECLKNGVTNNDVEIASFMSSVESALKQTVTKIQELEQDFYQAVPEQVDPDAIKALLSSGQEFSDASSQATQRVTRGVVRFEGLEDDEDLLEDLQQVGAVFTNLLSDEGNNKKVTIKDLPKILKTVEEKIGSIQNLLKVMSDSNRDASPSDRELILSQVKAHVLEVGKKLSQLSQIFNDSTITDSIEDKDLKSFKNQLAKLAKIVLPKRNAALDPQMIGECLLSTLDFIHQVQILLPAIQALEPQIPDQFSGRLNLNWKKVTAYTGSTAAVLAAVIAVGQQQGWWSLAAAAV